MENETYINIFESREVTVDFIKDVDLFTKTEEDGFNKNKRFPLLNIESESSM